MQQHEWKTLRLQPCQKGFIRYLSLEVQKNCSRIFFGCAVAKIEGHIGDCCLLYISNLKARWCRGWHSEQEVHLLSLPMRVFSGSLVASMRLAGNSKLAVVVNGVSMLS